MLKQRSDDGFVTIEIFTDQPVDLESLLVNILLDKEGAKD